MMNDKAARILDAAESLLLAYGYRKVTVDEVARRAGVGKGTVYLYWPSKLELFGAVLTRDSAALLERQLAGLRTDPAEVRPSLAMRRTFLDTMRRPVSRALSTGDHTVLGELLRESKTGAHFAMGKAETTEHYLRLLWRHGLLADDPAREPLLPYRLSAAATGAFLLEPGLGGETDLEARADALAVTMRRAFEPATEPSATALRAAADELAGLYRQWLTELTDSLGQ